MRAIQPEFQMRYNDFVSIQIKNRVLIGKGPVMKFSLPIIIYTMFIGAAFSIASCKNEEPANEVKNKPSVLVEEAEEEVKY